MQICRWLKLELVLQYPLVCRFNAVELAGYFLLGALNKKIVGEPRQPTNPSIGVDVYDFAITQAPELNSQVPSLIKPAVKHHVSSHHIHIYRALYHTSLGNPGRSYQGDSFAWARPIVHQTFSFCCRCETAFSGHSYPYIPYIPGNEASRRHVPKHRPNNKPTISV